MIDYTDTGDVVSMADEAISTAAAEKALILALALDSYRSAHLPHVVVVLPLTAPAEQCNRLMFKLEALRYVERVEWSSDVDQVQVLNVRNPRALGWADCPICGERNAYLLAGLPLDREHQCPPSTTQPRGITGLTGITRTDEEAADGTR